MRDRVYAALLTLISFIGTQVLANREGLLAALNELIQLLVGGA